MFCKICGKEYTEGSKFCIHCGAKIESSETPAESAAVPAEGSLSANEPEKEQISVTEAEINKPAESGLSVPEPINSSVSYGTVITPEPAAASAPVTPAESVIRPVERSNSGVSSYDFTVTAPPEQQKPEKYYTFGHLALCLAAVAVMAIVAGVFAGLYFSAIA
ncbi:MAG: zinc-ribbon domain-containing protein [Oscillospiraceae bacterium]